MKKKQILTILAVLLALTMALTGCSANGKSAPQAVDGKEEASDDLYQEGYGSGEAPMEPGSGEQVAAGRKIIRDVYITAETEEFDAMIANLNQRINSCGGYVESSYINNGSLHDRSGRDASLTIRIPASRMDEFLASVGDSSNIVRMQEDQKDVTLAFVDVESRKKALEIEQERLLALLEKSGSLSEIITLEDRLTDVRYELENMASTLRSLSNQVEYGTVFLTVEEVLELTPAEEVGFWQEIGGGFMRNLRHMGQMAADLFAFLVVTLPYLAIPIVIMTIVIVFDRKKRRRRKEKTEKPAE